MGLLCTRPGGFRQFDFPLKFLKVEQEKTQIRIAFHPSQQRYINIYKIFFNILKILRKYLLKQKTIKIFVNVFKFFLSLLVSINI